MHEGPGRQREACSVVFANDLCPLTGLDALEQQLKRCIARFLEAGVFPLIGEPHIEHSSKKSRGSSTEFNIGDSHSLEGVERIFCFGSSVLHRFGEPSEAFRRDGSKQSTDATEVVHRCGVAHARSIGRFP